MGGLVYVFIDETPRRIARAKLDSWENHGNSTGIPLFIGGFTPWQIHQSIGQK